MNGPFKLVRTAAVTVLALAGAAASPAFAAANDPFTTLAPGFTQSLYATDLPTAGGVAFAPDGDPLVALFTLSRIDSATTTTVNGSAVHPTTTSAPATALSFGLVNGIDGTIYANTAAGVKKIDASGNLLAGPAGAAGDGLGITIDPQTGDVVYVTSTNGIARLAADFSSTGVVVPGPGPLIDGIAFDPTGNYLFAATPGFAGSIRQFTRAGVLVQTIPTGTRGPDGMTFHAGAPQFMVSVNNDGTITRYDFPGGDLTQAPVQSVFASGGFRGDLTQVGADGCLYVTQGGTRFADGTVTDAGSLVQICGGFIPASALTAAGYKRLALDDLAGIVPSGDKDTDKRVTDAIDMIQASLDAPNWTDENHIDGKNADKIFEMEKSAVKSLMGIKGTVPPGATQAIADLLSADDSLAQTAIDDMTAAGGDPKKLAEANKEMDKANSEIAKGHFDAAIDHFKNAWKKAQKA